jgi:ribosomal protein S12 methylthiotransferase
LIDAILSTGVAYFDLSLQHVSKPLLRRMRRWGDGSGSCGASTTSVPGRPTPPSAATSFVGYPGETEEDHDQLLRFVEQAQLDWCGFFRYSAEEGTYAAGLDGCRRRRG